MLIVWGLPRLECGRQLLAGLLVAALELVLDDDVLLAGVEAVDEILLGLACAEMSAARTSSTSTIFTCEPVRQRPGVARSGVRWGGCGRWRQGSQLPAAAAARAGALGTAGLPEAAARTSRGSGWCGRAWAHRLVSAEPARPSRPEPLANSSTSGQQGSARLRRPGSGADCDEADWVTFPSYEPYPGGVLLRLGGA